MQHPTRTKTTYNPDGTRKTLGQLMKATLTVAQYGRYLAAEQQKSASRG